MGSGTLSALEILLAVSAGTRSVEAAAHGMARMKRVAPPPLVYKLYIQPFNPRKPHKFGMRIALPLLARDRKQPATQHLPAAEQPAAEQPAAAAQCVAAQQQPSYAHDQRSSGGAAATPHDSKHAAPPTAAEQAATEQPAATKDVATKQQPSSTRDQRSGGRGCRPWTPRLGGGGRRRAPHV